MLWHTLLRSSGVIPFNARRMRISSTERKTLKMRRRKMTITRLPGATTLEKMQTSCSLQLSQRSLSSLIEMNLRTSITRRRSRKP